MSANSSGIAELARQVVAKVDELLEEAGTDKSSVLTA
jgi:enamine deaminase RidA (YjgF/YER057c/UK114 family)